MLQTFHEMWAELLEELVYCILDHITIKSVHSLNHWNLVVCEDVLEKCDPQNPLKLVSLFISVGIHNITAYVSYFTVQLITKCSTNYSTTSFC